MTSSKQPIVAGIICTATCEILETIQRPSSKTQLFLKVRDELNAAHGQNAYMVFDLSGMIGSNLDYVKRHVSPDKHDLLKPLYLYRDEYQLHEAQKTLSRLQTQLGKINQTYKACLAIYDKEDGAPNRAIIDDAFDSEIEQANDEIKEVTRSIAFLKKNIAKHTMQNV